MNKDEIKLLNNYSKNLTQRELAEKCEFALGKVNKILTKLKEDNIIVDNKINKSKVQDYKVKNAIILAAGPGLRMIPINDEVPKQLLVINGEVLIERMINQLHEKGIEEIFVVVGYKKESFEYLANKYNVKLVINRDYGSDNNIRSLFLASKYIENTYVIPGDLYFIDNPFNQYELNSYYVLSDSEKRFGYFYKNKQEKLIIGKNKFFDAVGLSFIQRKDAKVIKDSLSSLVEEGANTYWESSLFYDDDFEIEAKTISKNSYFEINTYEDLRRFDPLSEHLDNANIATICSVFGVDRDDIKNVKISKKGMTNRSFFFEVNGKKYIMRIPGEGTEKLINRAQEYAVYQIVSPLGISDKIIYMNPESGVKITEFFADSRNCDAFNWDDVAVAMKKLKAFHELKLSVDFTFDIFGQILYYEKLMGEKSLYQDYDEVKKAVFGLKPYIDRVKLPFQLCHIDSVPDNFLIGKNETKLIDWEYSSNQDPHVDIAMFAIYSGYDRNQIDKLIDIYFNSSCDLDTRMKIYAYVAMSGFLWSNWCEYKAHLGVEFGEYSLSQYRYAKEYSKIVLDYLGSEK